jgi:hypothetical protein
MTDTINMSAQEAGDVLRKWMEENRIIHVTVLGNGVLVKLPGRLDRVDTIVHFSLTKSSMPLGSYAFLTFPMDGADFQYGDAAHAPEPLRSQITGYDALLYAYRQGVTVAFAVFPEGDNLQL